MKSVINFFAAFTILACLFYSTSGFAQTPSKKEIELAIQKMAQLIDENYVFPETGKKMTLHLVKEHKQGTFKAVKSWKEFDSLSTRVLQESSHDGHMYVRNDPKWVKEFLAIKKVPEIGDFSEDPHFYGNDAVQGNFGFKEVKVLEGNIGYIKLSEINISEKSLPVLFASMAFVANTNALIIDLQHNGGGGSAIGHVFESFFLPKETPLLEFRKRGEAPKLSKTVAWLTEKKYDKPLYILTSNSTFSAAEALAYTLQATKRAIIVGQPSGGGAHMNSWYPVNEHIFISVSTGAPTLPGTEESWQGKGVQPDHVVPVGQEIAFIKNLLGEKLMGKE